MQFCGICEVVRPDVIERGFDRWDRVSLFQPGHAELLQRILVHGEFIESLTREKALDHLNSCFGRGVRRAVFC